MNINLDTIFEVLTKKTKEAHTDSNPQKTRDAFMFMSGVYLVMHEVYGEDKELEGLLNSLKEMMLEKCKAEILEL